MIEHSKPGREDIEALLPWYEKGTLPPHEARLVEEYLRANPEGLRFLELIREEVGETIEANEQAGMPSRGALDRLMGAIEAEPKRAVSARRAGGVLARLFGAGAAPWLPVAAVAACLVILVQAATLGVLMLRDGPGGPTVATGPTSDPARPTLASGDPAADNGRFVLLRFSPGATIEDISTLLRSLNAVVVDGPKPGNVYRVRISNQPLQNEQIEAILQQIRSRSDIISIVSGPG